MPKKRKKKKNRIMLGPVITIILLTIIVMIFSFSGSMLGIQSQITSIVNGTLESSLVTVKNVFTVEGIQFLFGNIVSNFRAFEPLVLIIMSFMMVSIGEASGFFKAVFTPFRRLNSKATTFLVFFLGIISSIIGEYSYVLLLPLVSIMYKYLGKNQVLGVLTVFLGITLGYGTGLFYNYDDYLLGTLTQQAATVDVDKSYAFHPISTLYIELVSTVILSVVGTIIICKFLEPRFKRPVREENNLETSHHAFVVTGIVFLLMIVVIGYMIFPHGKLPGMGILLDQTETAYIAQLFGNNAPFKDGIMVILLLMAMICGGIYGYLAGNIKNTHEYSVDLSKSFDNIGYVFVLMFFTSFLIGVLEWSNLGEVVGAGLVEFMSSLQFSGIPLIIVMFFIIIVMSILIPSTITKWMLASPMLVPLFMRSNITPDFTQFIFRAADGVGKAITPLFIYFIVMIAFLQKDNKTKDEVTIFGTIRMMMPTVFLLGGLWLLIIVGWFIVGVPLGPGGFSTL